MPAAAVRECFLSLSVRTHARTFLRPSFQPHGAAPAGLRLAASESSDATLHPGDGRRPCRPARKRSAIRSAEQLYKDACARHAQPGWLRISIKVIYSLYITSTHYCLFCRFVYRIDLPGSVTRFSG